jgi:lipopolysaccharide biosynthesis regulator YciM
VGQWDEAAAALREAIAVSESPALATAALGVVAAARGRPDEARAMLADLEASSHERYVSPVAFVMVHAALGQADPAFAWLDRAYEERRGWLAYLNVEPTLDGLRGDARFRRLLERMRLA